MIMVARRDACRVGLPSVFARRGGIARVCKANVLGRACLQRSMLTELGWMGEVVVAMHG